MDEIPLSLPIVMDEASPLAVTKLAPTGRELIPFGHDTMEDLIALYTGQVEEMHRQKDLFLLEGMTCMADARAAVLAIRALSDKPIWVTFACDDEGRTPTGTDVLAALIVMEGMGVSAFGLDCADGVEVLTEQLERLTPYTSIPLIGGSGTGIPVEKDPDVIPCASEKEARFITPDIDVGETIECTSDLLEDILAAEETSPQGALKIEVLEWDDVDIFAEHQYGVRDALCLTSDVPELLEGALRVYQGRAFWDGTEELEEEFLAEMSQKYGLVIL